MIQFEHLTLSSPDVAGTLLDYRELIGVGASADHQQSVTLDNIDLRIRDAETGGRPGVEAVGLVGAVQGRRGRWTLGSPAASDATTLSEVPFEADAEATPADGAGPTDPSAIHAVDHIVIRSRDVDATRRLFEDGFGVRVLFDREFPEWKVRLCMCRVGDAVLEIAGSLAQAPGQDIESGEDGDGADVPVRDQLWGVTWRARDIAAAHSRIVENGFDCSVVRVGRRPGTRVFTVRDRTGDVPTLIIQPAD